MYDSEHPDTDVILQLVSVHVQNEPGDLHWWIESLLVRLNRSLDEPLLFFMVSFRDVKSS